MQGEIDRDHHLVFTAEIEDSELDSDPIHRHSLGKVRRRSGSASAGHSTVVRSSGPLVGDLERLLEPTDQGIPAGPDTRRRLEDSLEPSCETAVGPCESLRGLPDLQFDCARGLVQCRYLSAAVRSGLSGVVETRRLELLTLSLQRRCSSS